MAIDGSASTSFSTEQVIDRHASNLALDIPERHINARECIVGNRSVAPIPIDLTGLPNIFDVGNIFTY